MMDQECISLADIRRELLCTKGARAWCVNNNVSWMKILDGKMTIRELEALRDPLADRVIKAARARIAGGK